MYEIENQGYQYFYRCAAFDRNGGGQLNCGKHLCFGKNANRLCRGQKLIHFNAKKGAPDAPFVFENI